jgi:hypothetical protein
VWITSKPHEANYRAKEEPTKVAGRAAILRTMGQGKTDAQLIWQLPDGRWAMVGGMTPTVPLATLHRVADSVTTQPSPPLDVALTLRALPDGYRVTGWSGGQPGTASVTLCRTPFEPRTGPMPADCVVVSLRDGTAPRTLQEKTDTGGLVDVPIDQVRDVNGVRTSATADGTTVVAQVNAQRWVQVWSKGAGVDLLRQVAASTTTR